MQASFTFAILFAGALSHALPMYGAGSPTATPALPEGYKPPAGGYSLPGFPGIGEYKPAGSGVPPPVESPVPSPASSGAVETEIPVPTPFPNDTSNYGQGPKRQAPKRRLKESFECRVSSSRFEPKVISAKKGDTITFKVKGKFGIRHGSGDSTSCVPRENNTNSDDATTSPEGESTVSYTIPDDASDKIYFYNVEGDECNKADMSATVNISSNLVADTTASNGTINGTATAGGPAPIATASSASKFATLALILPLSFLAVSRTALNEFY